MTDFIILNKLDSIFPNKFRTHFQVLLVLQIKAVLVFKFQISL